MSLLELVPSTGEWLTECIVKETYYTNYINHFEARAASNEVCVPYVYFKALLTEQSYINLGVSS